MTNWNYFVYHNFWCTSKDNLWKRWCFVKKTLLSRIFISRWVCNNVLFRLKKFIDELINTYVRKNVFKKSWKWWAIDYFILYLSGSCTNDSRPSLSISAESDMRMSDACDIFSRTTWACTAHHETRFELDSRWPYGNVVHKLSLNISTAIIFNKW